MAGKNSIQILRGAQTYDPSTAETILADGQPFYSKKNKKIYIGDGTSPINQLKGTDIGLNLENDEGVDSLVQKYTGEVDETHYGNTNTGESATVFGEANENNGGNRALMWGKLNKNSGQNLVGGLRNNVGGSQNIVAGQQNGGVETEYDSITKTATVPINAQTSLIVGEKNKVGGLQKVNCSLVAGIENNVGYIKGTNGTDGPIDYSVIAGQSNNVFNLASSIISGNTNKVESSGSAIVGGNGNEVTHSRRSIIAGVNNTSTPLGSASSDPLPIDSLMVGVYNENHCNSSIIGGLRVHNFAQSSLLIGEDNQNYSYGSIIAGKDNKSGNESIVTENNIVGGQNNTANAGCSLIIGQHNKVNNPCSIIGGYYNIGKTDTLFEIGNGTADGRLNAFEVLTDGRAKVQSPPIESDDVVRKQDIPTNYVTTDTEQFGEITSKKYFGNASSWTEIDNTGVKPNRFDDEYTKYGLNWINNKTYEGEEHSFNFPEKGGTFALTSDIPTNYVTTDTEQNIEADKTFAGNVIVRGNLAVQGTTTTVDTETLKVKDNVVVANSDGIDLVDNAGFAIRTDTTGVYGIMYNPVDDGVMIGEGVIDADGKFTYIEGEAQYLATVDWTIPDGNVPQWNATKRTFEDSGVNMASKADKSELPVIIRVK